LRRHNNLDDTANPIFKTFDRHCKQVATHKSESFGCFATTGKPEALAASALSRVRVGTLTDIPATPPRPGQIS